MNAKKTAKVAPKSADAKTLLDAAKRLGKLEIVTVGDKPAAKVSAKPALKAAAKPALKAAAKPALKATAKPALKAAEKSTVPSKKITVLNRECPHAEGSHRAASWAALLLSNTSDEYAANGGAHKYLARWAAKGLITLE